MASMFEGMQLPAAFDVSLIFLLNSTRYLKSLLAERVVSRTGCLMTCVTRTSFGDSILTWELFRLMSICVMEPWFVHSPS